MIEIYKKCSFYLFVLIGGLLQAQQNPNIQFIVTAPANLAGTYSATSGSFGKILDYSAPGPMGALSVVNDGGAMNGETGCAALTNGAQISGKIALVRRGGCEFGVKCLNAEMAGAIAAVVINNAPGGSAGMGAGAVGASVTIPCLMISMDDGNKLIDAIKAGVAIEASISIPAVNTGYGPWQYSTPIAQAITLTDLQVNFANVTDKPYNNITMTATITEPDNTVVKIESLVPTIAPAENLSIAFEDYTPSKEGNYNLEFSNSLNNEKLSVPFQMSKHSWQLDNLGDGPGNSLGWITLTADAFGTGLGRYEMGAYYPVGPNGAKVTHATFAIDNVSALPNGDDFYIALFDLDPDGDGAFDGGAQDYSSFPYVALSIYKHDNTLPNRSFVTVQLEDILGNGGPIELKPNGQYLLMIQYSGNDNPSKNITVPPRFVYNSQIDYAYSGEVIWTTRLFMGGWAGEYNIVARLHENGFTVKAKDLPELSDNELNVFPTITDQNLFVQFDLLETSKSVKAAIVDFNGKIVREFSYDNILDQKISIPVGDLRTGTYFYSVITDKGYDSKVFKVVQQ